MKLTERQNILIKILAWLYTNDGEFDSGVEWRVAFIKFLKKLLN